MPVQCKKCPYFGSVKQDIKKGAVVVGFCRLRQKHISDMSITQLVCKDRAVVDL